MIEAILSILFALVIIIAAFVYFRKRKKKLQRMETEEAIEDLFSSTLP